MRRRGAVLGVLAAFLAIAGTTHAAHLAPDTLGHTDREQDVVGMSDPANGYTQLTVRQVNEQYVLRDGITEPADTPGAAAPAAQAGRQTRRVSLAYFSQMTDFQLADEESPVRVEFADQVAGSAWRPHEAFHPFAIDASVRQINAFAGASPVPQGDGTRNQMDIAVITGDQADNQQRNETIWVRELLEGGETLNFNSGLTDPAAYSPTSLPSPTCQAFVAQEGGQNQAAQEGARYTGVQDYDDYPAVPNTYYYDPDQPAASWAADGWPQYTGLMDRAQALSITPAGLDVPFYITNGNHDVLVQGNEDANQAFEDIAVGCTKVLGTTAPPTSPPDPDEPDALSPSALLSPAGPPMLIPPDPLRRFVSKPQIKKVYGEDIGGDDDHGFAHVDPVENQKSSGSASYYAWDPPQMPGFRFISVDTNSEGGQTAEGAGAGSSNGNIDDPQFQWLRRELDAAQAADKLTVLFGHHPVRSMNTVITDEQAVQCSVNDNHPGDDPQHDVNPGCDLDTRLSTPIHLGQPSQRPPGNTTETFVELLGNYPNVIAYVPGHTHDNRVTPFARSDGSLWWELNTSAVADNPQQSRLIEVFDNRDDTLSIFSNVIDHASPSTAPAAGDASGFDSQQLASIGRTFAYNDPQGGSPGGEGGRRDQNVELLVDDPRPQTDLSLTKTDSPDPVVAGETLTYTIGVRNEGSEAAQGTTVTDDLPEGVSFVSADSSAGSCTEATDGVTCSLGVLAGGATATVNIVVTPQSAGQLTNAASARANVQDPDTANDTASATTTVTPAASGPGTGNPGPGGPGPGSPSNSDEVCRGELATIVGTDGDDSGDQALIGTDGDDVIVALGGDDDVKGGKGEDLICGKGGNDDLRGNGHDDGLRGGGGNDDLGGGSGDDSVGGGAGRDDVSGGGGDDDCNGGTGRDHARKCEQGADGSGG